MENSYLAGIKRSNQRILINQCSARSVDNNHAILHLAELGRTDDVSGGRVQREVKTEDVGVGEELVEGDVGGSGFEFGGEARAVVVLDLHAEGLGPSSHFLVILSVDSTLVVIERCFVLPAQYRPCPGYREPCPGGHDRWWSLLATCLLFEQN